MKDLLSFAVLSDVNVDVGKGRVGEGLFTFGNCMALIKSDGPFFRPNAYTGQATTVVHRFYGPAASNHREHELSNRIARVQVHVQDMDFRPFELSRSTI